MAGVTLTIRIAKGGTLATSLAAIARVLIFPLPKAAIIRHSELHQQAYEYDLWKPKHHFALHLADRLRRDGYLVSSFLMERPRAERLVLNSVAWARRPRFLKKLREPLRNTKSHHVCHQVCGVCMIAPLCPPPPPTTTPRSSATDSGGVLIRPLAMPRHIGCYSRDLPVSLAPIFGGGGRGNPTPRFVVAAGRDSSLERLLKRRVLRSKSDGFEGSTASRRGWRTTGTTPSILTQASWRRSQPCFP